MSEIKLPVTVEAAFDMADLYDANRAFLASGAPENLEAIAAALNAAPKRAFEELTYIELLSLLAQLHRNEITVGGLLRALQAFAAPEEPAVVTAVKPQDGASVAAVSVPGWATRQEQGGPDHG